jgi:hypothetical protein
VVLIEDLSYRQIFLDGRELPKDPDPSFTWVEGDLEYRRKPDRKDE